jgi:NADH dehydrogenase
VKRVVVTGGHGFIGSHLVRTFADHGWHVTALSRRATESANDDNILYARYRLGKRFTYNGDVLIHCAYDATAEPRSNFNVDASVRLFREARNAGFSKIVFLSSLAASPDTQSSYGRQKYLTEKHLDLSHDLVIRPGLVVGKGGLFDAMRQSLKRFRIAPVFDGGRQPVYVIAISDLSSAVLRLTESNASGLFTIAAPSAMPLRELYQNIAAADALRIYLIPLPQSVTLWFASLCERLRLKMPVSAESIRGVRNLKYLDVPQYPQIGFTPMSAESAMALLGGQAP